MAVDRFIAVRASAGSAPQRNSWKRNLDLPAAAQLDPLHHRAALGLRAGLPLDAARGIPDAVGHLGEGEAARRVAARCAQARDIERIVALELRGAEAGGAHALGRV